MKRAVVTLMVAALLAQGSAPAQGSRDPLLDQQWGLDAIDAPGAWHHSRGEGALIAIVDTGVDLQHPDLRANLAGKGFDFPRNRRGGDDELGHGTMVAGVAAAIGSNGLGISGVAPAAHILPVRVCVDATCRAEVVAKGIRYAARRGADVINLSLGVGTSEEGFPKVLEAVKFAGRRGSIVVAAAGNSSEPWCSEPASSAVCVGALDQSDQRTIYTNGDVLMSDDYLVAPGGGEGTSCEGRIVTTWIDAPTACEMLDGYASGTGTSLAAPFVTGVAALLAGLGASRQEIHDCLLETTDDLGPEGRDAIYGYGKVNARRAVLCAH